MSTKTLHRKLKTVGWDSGRKKRSDAGKSSQDETALVEIGSMLKEGLRRNGKATMHITTARSILAQNGRKFSVSNAQLGRLLRQLNMDMATQTKPQASQNLISLHPNHVHEVDPSLCLLYYTPGGKQQVLRDDEIYKNKPGWVEKIGNLKCWRYVLIDHFSATIVVRYYQARAETQVNLYDFLLYAWQKIDIRVFHGVPELLYCDKGSANTAGGLRNALTSLGIALETHKAGNARATGAVEVAQNIVETQFESRLKYQPVSSVDELNAAAEHWYNAWNSNAIPDYDSRLRRYGLKQPTARYGIWQVIRQHQLRLLPDLTLCRYLMVNDPVDKPVGSNLDVSFKFPGDAKTTRWDVAHIPGIGKGSRVVVQPLIYGEKQILVSVTDYQGNSQSYTARPAEFDSTSGFKLSGAVIGQEYKSLKDSDVDKAGKTLDKTAYPDMPQDEIEKQRKKNAVPLGGLDTLSHLENVNAPDYMNRHGTEIDLPNKLDIDTSIKTLSFTQAAMQLSREYEVAMDAGKNDLIKRWYAEQDGVPENEIADLADRLNNVNATTSLSRLKLV